MADTVMNSFKKKLMEGSIDLVNDTIKFMLLTSTHVINADTHEFIDDVSVNEVSGTGYTAGGATLGTKTVTQDNTDDEGVFDAADISWPSSSITARYGVLYKDTGTPATSPIIGVFDFGEDKTSDAGDFNVTINAEGLLNIN